MSGLKQVNQIRTNKVSEKNNIYYTLYVDGYTRTAQLKVHSNNNFSISTGQANYEITDLIPSEYRPKANMFQFVSRSQYLSAYVWSNGYVGISNFYGSGLSDQSANCLFEWEY